MCQIDIYMVEDRPAITERTVQLSISGSLSTSAYRPTGSYGLFPSFQFLEGLRFSIFFIMGLPTMPKLYNTYFLAVIATIGGML